MQRNQRGRERRETGRQREKGGGGKERGGDKKREKGVRETTERVHESPVNYEESANQSIFKGVSSSLVGITQPRFQRVRSSLVKISQSIFSIARLGRLFRPIQNRLSCCNKRSRPGPARQTIIVCQLDVGAGLSFPPQYYFLHSWVIRQRR